MRFIGFSHVSLPVMSRDVPAVVAFALAVVVTVSVVALPASALGGATATVTTPGGGVAPQTTNGSANASESLAPGQRLAGVVGVQGAEIDGELEERTLETRVDRAASNGSKAAVVATELNTARGRLRDLRETQAALREARRSGELSTGEYRARMAITAAQIRAVRTQLDSSEAVSRDLPDAALEARGVNREEIDRLREDADELRGPEVAAIARQIAGDDGDAGNGERGGPPEDAGNGERGGPPEDAGNGDGNRSETAGPPDEAEDGEEADDSDGGPGNSGDAGNGGDSDDGPGNSGDAGNGDDSDDGPGNSGDAGNGDDSDDGPGNSGDAGNGEGSDGDGSSGGGNGDGGPGNAGGQGGGSR